MRTLLLLGLAMLVVGCGGTAMTPSPTVVSPTPSILASAVASGRLELPADTPDLPAGRYALADVGPGLAFELEEGWSSGPVGDGSVELSRPVDGGDVVARLVVVDAASADAAAETIQATPALTVLATSGSRMSGLTGPNLELENASTAPVEIASLTLAPGERMWLSMFDTDAGVVAVVVTSDAGTWDAALLAVEPFLETVAIGS